MKKEGAKEKVIEILKKCTNRRNFKINEYPHTIMPEHPLSVWSAIKFVIGELPLPYNCFEKVFLDFKKEYKRDSQKAINNCISNIFDSKPTQATIPSIPKKIKKPKGKKTRKIDLNYYKALIEYFEDKKPFYDLIALKSYRLEKYIYEEQSCLYIRNFYGSPPDDYTINRKKYHSLNDMIMKTINGLKEDLQLVTNDLFSDKKIPRAKTWFVDVFKEASERYLTNLRQYQRKSKNKPNFEKSFKIFKKFIVKGKTSKELGFKRYEYHNLRYKIIPQGLIKFLFKIHQLLYHAIDSEKPLLEEKTQQIKAILKDIPKAQAYKLLSNLLPTYTPSTELGGLLDNIEK